LLSRLNISTYRNQAGYVKELKMNDFQENPNATEQYFKTPEGNVIGWTKLLLIKSEVLLSTGKEIDIKTALRIVDFLI
jgi:hypothetical protein